MDPFPREVFRRTLRDYDNGRISRDEAFMVLIGLGFDNESAESMIRFTEPGWNDDLTERS